MDLSEYIEKEAKYYRKQLEKEVSDDTPGSRMPENLKMIIQAAYTQGFEDGLRYEEKG